MNLCSWSEEKIVDFAARRMPHEERLRLAQHMPHCPQCLQRYEIWSELLHSPWEESLLSKQPKKPGVRLRWSVRVKALRRQMTRTRGRTFRKRGLAIWLGAAMVAMIVFTAYGVLDALRSGPHDSPQASLTWHVRSEIIEQYPKPKPILTIMGWTDSYTSGGRTDICANPFVRSARMMTSERINHCHLGNP